MTGKTRYHSIDEIPDDLIPRTSKRDPDNQLYKTRRWVNFKKRQILFSQNDGIPVAMRTPGMRFANRFIWASSIGLFIVNIYYLNKFNSPQNK